MIFTGHAKELFESYYSSKGNQYFFITGYGHIPLPMFYDLPIEIQIGVIEDFAESLGYYIYFVGITGAFYEYEINIKGTTHYILGESKQQAREELIKELNKIINE